MGRREEKREATKQEILSAASELFLTKGYEATSVDDIVLAANLAKGTFYYHFQAKEDLITALQEAELKKAAENARAKLADAESPLEVLFDFVADAAHWTEANPELARSVFKQKFAMMARPEGKDCPPQQGPPPSIKMYFFDLISEIVTAGQQKQQIRSDIPASDLSRIIIATAMSARMSFLLDGQGSLTSRTQNSLKIVLEGIKPQQ